MSILAIVVIVLIGIFLLAGLILKKKLFINKFVILLLIVAVGYLVISNNIGGDKAQSSQVNIPEYQQKAPDISQAPRVVQTTSRIYYVATFKDTGTVVILYDYFTYSKNKWVFTNKHLVMDRKYYGEIKIYNR